MTNFKIRCSQISKIIIEPKSKKEATELSETTTTYLKNWWVEQTFNRKKSFYSLPTEKGNLAEEQAITLLSLHQRLGLIEKNEKTFENDFLIGTPDIIHNNIIWDIKSSWDIFTFPFLETELPNKEYYWQMQGYMALTNTNLAKIAYCLVDTPENLILKECYNEASKQGLTVEEVQDYVKQKHTFDDIPKKYKVKIFEIKRNEQDIEKIYSQVEKCRKWLTKIKI
jgi:hypothetical protein